MILVKLYGGLGNQMFQYAAARSLSIRLNTSVAYDDEYFLFPERFGSQWPYALDQFQTQIVCFKPNESKRFDHFLHRVNRKLNTWGLKRSSYFFEVPNKYNTEFEHIKNPCVLDGYFQSYRYFQNIREVLLDEFKPRQALTGLNSQLAADMKKQHSISLHVRRGDYISNAEASKVHGTCDLKYYNNAIQVFESQFRNPVFYIFSDDLQWARENLNFQSTKIFVDHNSDKNYLDLYLMSQCQHNIIANSSFSWWGAWLNSNKSKLVTAPKRWFLNKDLDLPDLLPPEWKRIE